MRGFARFTLSIAIIILGVWFIWTWGFCRFYINPDQMAVITAKIGRQLSPDQILADPGQKGIQANVLGEGRHFLNPILYEREIRPVVLIPAGKIGIVTSKVGKKLMEDEFLAGEGEKGIWRKVLGPGKYRFNPYGYKIELVPAVSIPIGYAGVVTSLSGQQAPAGEFAAPNEKGVRKDILQPALYYANPKEFKIDILEIGINQVSLLGRMGGEVITKGRIETKTRAMDRLEENMLMQQQQKRADYTKKSKMLEMRSKPLQSQIDQIAKKDRLPKTRQEYVHDQSFAALGLAQFVEFPSRDGFDIRLDMTVEFSLEPEHISMIFMHFGDLPAVVDKIIMPQILSISRLKGSAYRAKDFIVGLGREKFQNDLTETLKLVLEEKDKNIIIHNALIRHVAVPMQILDPIQQASIAIERDKTNKEKQNTAKKKAELNTELTLIDQRRQQVAQETKKIKAEINADREKQVAEITAEATRLVAQIEKETAAVYAEKIRKLGKAEADAVKMIEGEKAKGVWLKAEVFDNPLSFSMWEFANKLNRNVTVNILHAGEGTLWTDLQKARMGDLAPGLYLKQNKEK